MNNKQKVREIILKRLWHKLSPNRDQQDCDEENKLLKRNLKLKDIEYTQMHCPECGKKKVFSINLDSCNEIEYNYLCINCHINFVYTGDYVEEVT